MSLIDLFILICVAGVCGAIGQAIAGESRGGCLVSIALGFVGAVFGLWIARALSLPTVFVLDTPGGNFPIVWSIVGSALFVALVRLLSGRRDR